MAVVHLTRENFENEVLKSDKPVFIDFWASWCGPCKMVEPVVEELSNEQTVTKIAKVNVDEQQELAQAFNVRSIPFFALVKEGKVVKTTVGAQSKAALLKVVNS